MCHGLRACAEIRLGIALIVMLMALCAARETQAQTSAVVPPRSTLRIGDSKQTTPRTPPSASAAPSASASTGQGSRLEIRRPVALPPRPTLQPQPNLEPQPTLTPRAPLSAAPGSTLQLQPSAVNQTPVPTASGTTLQKPAYTASIAPLQPRAPLNARAGALPTFPTDPTDTKSGESGDLDIATDGALPEIVPPETTAPTAIAPMVAAPSAAKIPPPAAMSPEPTVVAVPVPARTSQLPTLPEATPATTPTTTQIPPIAPFPAEPTPIATANLPSTSPTFQPPPSSQAVDFPPTRTITRLPPAKAPPVATELDLLSPAPIPDPDEPGSLPKLEPVDFNGILLGESTAEEVLKAWGEPIRRTGAGNDLRLNYKLEPFDSIDVTFFDNKAQAIVIELGEKFPPAEIVKELSLNEADAVTVDDAAGQALGLVFPERGVSLRFETDGSSGPVVATIGLDRISARPFVLRAEKRLEQSYTAALTDLAIASNLDPKNSRAHWIRAKLLQKVGKSRAAMAAIESALKIDGKAADYLLTRAELLADEGFFDAAMADNETVMEGTKALPLYQARAWCQRGTFSAEGLQPNYAEAIEAHTRAVRLAEPLTNDPNRNLRRGAKRLLVEAHLAIAQDVAWGEYLKKEETVERWLKRAEALALEGRSSGDLPIDSLVDVYVRAASACVGTQGKGDPLPWAENLKRIADEALADCNDPLRRKHIQFDAGLGLYDALQALHARGDIDNALKFGTEAVELIQQGRVGRDETPIDAYRFGRLYFRIGSLYAVKRNDHATAVEWFDRAAPLLERPLAESAAADRGRQGETLVSMGISYWAGGNRERALQLTSIGASYMQQAVRDGVLAPPAMGVAYSNLATMHQQLGDETTSKKFVEMATRVEPAGAGVLRR